MLKKILEPGTDAAYTFLRVVTGLLFVDPAADDLHDHLNTVATPLNRLVEADLCPGAAALAALNTELS